MSTIIAVVCIIVATLAARIATIDEARVAEEQRHVAIQGKLALLKQDDPGLYAQTDDAHRIAPEVFTQDPEVAFLLEEMERSIEQTRRLS